MGKTGNFPRQALFLIAMMKNMSMETASAVGIPSKTSWSTTALRRTAGGVVYLACGFSGTEKAPHQGREFIHWFEEHTFEGPAQLYQHVRTYWQNINSGVAASIALVWQSETHITVMAFGYALVGLLRAGQGRWLIDGQQGEQVLEGDLRSGDRLILATARAQEVTPTLLTWAQASAEEIAGDLIPRVNSHQSSGELAYTILQWADALAEGTSAEAAEPAPLENAAPAPIATPEPPTRAGSAQSSLEPSPPQLEPDEEPELPLTSHLIAPEKIAAGIVATQQEQTQKVQRQKLSEKWVGLVARLRSLSWLRLVAAVVVIGGVIGSLMLWRYLNIRQETTALIQPLETEVQALQAIPAENRLEQRDAAKSLLEKLQATRAKYRVNRTKLIALTTQVEDVYQSVSGEKDVVNLPVFYDFRLAVANFLATRADRFEDQAVFLDTNDAKLITLNLQSKNNRTVTQEALANSVDVVGEAEAGLVLQAQSIQSFPYSGEDPTEVSALAEVTEPAFLERFSSNLYVLDKGKQQLWRINQGSETASPSGWIRSAPGVNLAAATSLAIDGDVWVGTNQGNIYRLRRGERIDFAVQGLLEPFTSTLLLAAVEDGQKLVAVEPGQNRFVVLNKEGVYQLQMRSEQIGGVTDVFLSQDEQYAYLVAGSVVYRVEI